MAIDLKYKKYGFHRYRKHTKYHKSDIISPEEKNWTNKKIVEYQGNTIFLEWHKGNMFSNKDNSYIVCYIFDSEDKYVAEYATTYKDIKSLISLTKRYIRFINK